MEYKPSVIIKCLSTQATYIKRKYKQMFYYTNTGAIWYDTQNGNRIRADDIYVLNYERERTNLVPDNRSTFATETDALTNDQLLLNYAYVYVAETNCLYRYNYTTKVWDTIYGIYGQTVVAQTYTPEGEAKIVNADDVTGNGILGDGSVVVRDDNRMICGLLLSDGYTLTIKSLIGGQINLEPSGTDISDGCLQLNASEVGLGANLNGDLMIFGTLKTTAKENWAKQYRIVTQDIKITSESTLKMGSTIKKGSVLNDTTLEEDRITIDDFIAKTGMILAGSKLYIGSSINGVSLKPPFLFDLEDTIVQAQPTHTTCLEWSLSGMSTIEIMMRSPFQNNGDCVYINNSSGYNLNGVIQVKFKDRLTLEEVTYPVSFVAPGGLIDVVTLKFCESTNSIKILP